MVAMGGTYAPKPAAPSDASAASAAAAGAADSAAAHGRTASAQRRIYPSSFFGTCRSREKLGDSFAEKLGGSLAEKPPESRASDLGSGLEGTADVGAATG